MWAASRGKIKWLKDFMLPWVDFQLIQLQRCSKYFVLFESKSLWHARFRWRFHTERNFIFSPHQDRDLIPALSGKSTHIAIYPSYKQERKEKIKYLRKLYLPLCYLTKLPLFYFISFYYEVNYVWSVSITRGTNIKSVAHYITASSTWFQWGCWGYVTEHELSGEKQLSPLVSFTLKQMFICRFTLIEL